MENSPLICKANQWIGFHIIGASIIKELKPYLIRELLSILFDLLKL